jgi:hypothetical protein
MKPIIKNSIAILAGLVLGNVVNLGIIMLSSNIIPPPEGADVTTMAGLKATMHLFEPKHFIMPFLAHALGTLIAVLVAVRFAASHHLKLAIGIAVVFLIAGLVNVFILPSPIWYTMVDLVGAYLPMGFLGHRLAIKYK